MKLSDPNKKRDFMALFLGRPGYGKSVAAASFVEAFCNHEDPTKRRSIYLADLDGRVESVRQAFGEYGDYIEYDTYSVNDFQKFNKKLDDLVLNCKYGAFIVDSYTSLADMLMQYSISLRGKDYNNTQGVKGVLEIADLQDYKAESNGLQSFMMKMKAIECPFKILTAHMLVTEYFNPIEQKNKVLKSVLTAGKKVTDKVPMYFDEVWEMYLKHNASSVSGARPYYCMNPVAEVDNIIKSAMGIPPLDFTKGPSNPEGSLFKVAEPYLKKAGFLS